MRKRIAFLWIGTCTISAGIACMAKGAIGMSPLSTCPFVLSCLFARISLGEWVLLWNMLFALLQIPLEGRNYRAYMLLQIPLAFLLGYVTDFAKYLLEPVPAQWYAVKALLVLLGTMLTALGVYLTVEAGLIMNGPEAFLQSIAGRTGCAFGTLKIIFAVANVLLAILLSISIMGEWIGIREGTVFLALGTGFFVNLYGKLLMKKEKVSHFCNGEKHILNDKMVGFS